MKKLRKTLLYVAFVLAAFVLAYFIAYPLGYSPLGYDVLEKKEGEVVLQSYNTLGLEEEKITYQPREEDRWKMDRLVERINQQESEYLLFFTSIIVATFWIEKEVLAGKSLKRVLLLSCLYVVPPGLSLLQHLNVIKDILKSTGH
ncbi:hypothetical protein MUN89_02960 [Halobacillus salinarum]|uniref:Uncharacterized protein n=1 Tax=Halobacillus salinarum TaxID=2932257 RepID=A0ABY4EL97_9BACI|nr:hypothetical protein [Halobacillus salinarum]UOQ44929.1 hypothetical protein MUN89_02960 [Halobacillus salinarum]